MNRKDFNTMITNQELKMINEGKAPYFQNIEIGTPAQGVPKNLQNKTPYSSVNLHQLSCSELSNKSDLWGTMSSINSINGQINKGEKGITISSGKDKFATVFNVSQTDLKIEEKKAIDKFVNKDTFHLSKNGVELLKADKFTQNIAQWQLCKQTGRPFECELSNEDKKEFANTLKEDSTKLYKVTRDADDLRKYTLYKDMRPEIEAKIHNRENVVYLNVSFEDKDKVHGLGAKWYPKAKSWGVNKDAENLDKFKTWLPEKEVKNVITNGINAKKEELKKEALEPSKSKTIQR